MCAPAAPGCPAGKGVAFHLALCPAFAFLAAVSHHSRSDSKGFSHVKQEGLRTGGLGFFLPTFNSLTLFFFNKKVLTLIVTKPVSVVGVK